MDREKIITIVIGLTVGILAAGTYFALAKFIPSRKKTTPNIVAQPLLSRSQTAAASLTLDKPEDNLVASKSAVIISGKVNPQAKIIIFSNAEEKIASPEASGKFGTEIKLEEGENEISVTALIPNRPPEVVKRKVILEVTP